MTTRLHDPRGRHASVSTIASPGDRPPNSGSVSSRRAAGPRSLASRIAVLLALGALVGALAACGSTSPTASPSPASVVPADPCSVVDAADVEAAFGGTSTPERLNGDGACSFDVTGPLHAAPAGASSGRVDISFATEHTPAADQIAVLGDAVEAVKGLGADAWWMRGALHVAVPGGELVVKGTWFGTLDEATLRDDTAALATVILGRL